MTPITCFTGALIAITASHAAAQVPGTGPLRLEAPSFVYARYATARPSSLVAAKGLGHIGVLTAMLYSPKSEYAALIAGVYTQASHHEQHVLMAMSYSDATDGKYVHLLLHPQLSFGPARLDAAIGWSQPLERTGARQLGLNPIALAVGLNRLLSIGAAYAVETAAGLPPRHALGPLAEVALQWGSLRVELLHGIAREPPELRASMFMAF